MSRLTHLIRNVAAALLPAPAFSRIQAVHSRNYQRKFLEREGLLKIGQEFSSRHGHRVLHGPFRGMKYTAEALKGRHAVPKLLGSYELELHRTIEIVQRTGYDRIVDVGCAEGYYAVGLALSTAAQIFAFDTEPRERQLCREMAAANGAEHKVTISSWCDAATLVSTAIGRTFILADCEGYEVELFNQGVVERLSRADLLIETHDSLVPGVTPTLLQRFGRTHQAEEILARQRDVEEFPELAFLADGHKRAISEYRADGARWLYFKARS